MKRFNKLIIAILILIVIGTICLFQNYFNDNIIQSDSALTFNEYGVLFSPEEIDSNCKDKYFYNQLNEDEKLYYQAMYYASINNTCEIEWTFFPDSIILKKAKRAFIEDWPLYYWWNYASFIYTDEYNFTNDKGENITYYVSYPEKTDKGSIKRNISKIEEFGETAVKACYDEDPYTYVKNIHDYVIDNTSYNLDAENAQTLLGAVIDKECVCEGYAREFQYLTNKAGFNCVSPEGLAKFPISADNPNINHKWNMIEINDVWYQVDCTWDDSYNDGQTHLYLLLNDNTMYIDHELGHITGFSYPVCDGEIVDVDNTVLIVDSYNTDEISEFINNNLSKNSYTFTLRLINDKDYDDALSWLVDGNGIYDLYFKHFGYEYPKNSYQYYRRDESNTIVFNL